LCRLASDATHIIKRIRQSVEKQKRIKVRKISTGRKKREYADNKDKKRKEY